MNVPEAIDPLLTPPESLLTSEPERSDVSVLDETHTADTAPATVPEPLLDEPASSAPVPPSDVFLRTAEPTPDEPELLLAPLDTPAMPGSAPRALLGSLGRARRGPYWEWALLGFSGTLLVVAMVLRQRGMPLFSAGLERTAPVVVATATLRPQPPAPAPQAIEPTPLPQLAPAQPVPTQTPRRKPGAKSAASATPKPAATPANTRPRRLPARDSVRAGLAQDLP